MIVLQKLTIFLIIFIYKFVETRFQFKTYITGVVGNITCDYNRGKGAFVAITTKKFNRYSKQIVSRKFVEYKKEFFIAGSTKYITKPILYFQIYHVCALYRLRSINIAALRIPDNFIHNRGKKVFFWRIGRLELSRLQWPSKQTFFH